jgi:HPt (histidine-containing phosphotransfer) domain-containing protein
MVDMDILQRKVAQLTASYVEKLPGYKATFNSIAQRLTSDPDRATVQELGELAHKLSGSAGSYGFAHMGKVAKELENICTNFLGGGDVLDDAVNEIIMALVTLISIIDTTINSESNPDSSAQSGDA